MQINDNIKRFRKLRNLTQQQVADRIGENRSTYAEWEGKIVPKIDTLIKIAAVLGVGLNDLTTEVDENTDRVTEPAPDYLSKRRKLKTEIGEFRVPLVTVKARAGYSASYDSVDLVNSLDKYAIPPGVNHHGAIWRYFEVDGDSMEDTFSAGDYILCSQVPADDWENINQYYVYVLVTDTEVLIKRVFVKKSGEWVLISDNEEDTPQRLFDKTQLKELWLFRRHIKRTASPKREFKIKV